MEKLTFPRLLKFSCSNEYIYKSPVCQKAHLIKRNTPSACDGTSQMLRTRKFSRFLSSSTSCGSRTQWLKLFPQNIWLLLWQFLLQRFNSSHCACWRSSWETLTSTSEKGSDLVLLGSIKVIRPKAKTKCRQMLLTLRHEADLFLTHSFWGEYSVKFGSSSSVYCSSVAEVLLWCHCYDPLWIKAIQNLHEPFTPTAT